jgi:hypothetical protein
MPLITIPTAADRMAIGEESVFATAPSMTPIVHVQGSAQPRLSQKEIEHNAASARLFARFASVLGLRSQDSGISFGVHIKPASAVLNASATPSTPYLGVLWRALLGGEHSDAGSTVAAGATTTSVPVTSGHGARFRVGQCVSIVVGGVRYARVVTAIATDTLTVWPALPSAPSSGAEVLNSYSYYLTQSNSRSLTVEHTHTVPGSGGGAETVQRRLRGCTGGMSLELTANELARCAFELTAADWDYGTLTIPTTPVAESMGDPMAVTSLRVYLQPAATTTDAHYCAVSVGTQFDLGNQHLRCLAGVQGVQGVARNGGRESATFTVRSQIDIDRYTQWRDRDLQRLLVLLEQGAGTARRFAWIYSNRVQVVGNPPLVEEGGFAYQDLTLRPVLDTSGAVDTAAGSPWAMGVI